MVVEAMIKEETFYEKNIRRIQRQYEAEPELAQRAVFALGLVEALVRVGAAFKIAISALKLLDGTAVV